MPYRRLPNTDQARIKALEGAIAQDGVRFNNQVVVSYKTIQDARTFLAQFVSAQKLYHQSFDSQVKSSKKYQTQVKNIRLYVSHFIQVLNMSVIRNEIKKENKKLYKLDVDDYSVPDLSTEAALLKWGENIITGENERLKSAGVPIYNPTIQKVNVHYNIFTEAYYSQKVLQNNTSRNLEKVAMMRQKADELILDIWNQAEEAFKDFETVDKVKRCQEFGVIYYYRTKEKRAMEAAQMQKEISFND